MKILPQVSLISRCLIVVESNSQLSLKGFFFPSCDFYSKTNKSTPLFSFSPLLWHIQSPKNGVKAAQDSLCSVKFRRSLHTHKSSHSWIIVALIYCRSDDTESQGAAWDLKWGEEGWRCRLSLRGRPSWRRRLGVLSLSVGWNRSSRNKAGGMLTFAPAEAKLPHYDACTVEAEAVKDFIAAVYTAV